MSDPEKLPVTQLRVNENDDQGVMGMIARVAAESGDVVKLEKLMDLQERILNRNAKQAFAADFVNMRPELPLVIRLKTNSQTKSKYAPIEDINKTIDPILKKYGFGTATKIISQNEKFVTVKAELWHRSGHIEENVVTMPLDDRGIAGTINKTLPHALSSSITYAKRVAICALLNISTGDDKDGNHDSGFVTIEEAADIDTRARAFGEKNFAQFLEYMHVEKCTEITARDYRKAINCISGWEKKAKAK